MALLVCAPCTSNVSELTLTNRHSSTQLDSDEPRHDVV